MRRKAAAQPVAKAKPKRPQVKKAARPVAPAEPVAVEVIEQPAPGVEETRPSLKRCRAQR